MYDFPTSAGEGGVSGEYTMRGGLWVRTVNASLPISMEPPADGKEYVQWYSTWYVKRQSASAFPYSTQVPPGARAMRWRVINWPTSTTASQCAILLSENNGVSYPQASGDYKYAGPQHWSGPSTPSYGAYPESVAPYLIGGMTTNNPLIPGMGRGFLNLKRASTSFAYSGWVIGSGQLNDATNMYGRYKLRTWAVNTSFTGTAINSVYFYSATAHSPTTGVHLTIDWIY